MDFIIGEEGSEHDDKMGGGSAASDTARRFSSFLLRCVLKELQAFPC
jgi:hypothetical protein